MTDLLFLTDSYLSEFESVVTKVEDDLIFLNKTAFYPEGGGQPCDTGIIYYNSNKSNVISVNKKDGDVAHKLSGPIPEVGVTIKGIIDWDNRYNYMKYHTALHILCGAVFELYGGLITGGQIYKDRARLDFDLEQFNKETVSKIENRTNEIVKENHLIQVKSIPREEAENIQDLIRTKVNLLPPNLKEIRLVDIVDFDQQADGGTHVASTGEVGAVKIFKTENKGKIRKRIEISLE